MMQFYATAGGPSSHSQFTHECWYVLTSDFIYDQNLMTSTAAFFLVCLKIFCETFGFKKLEVHTKCCLHCTVRNHCFPSPIATSAIKKQAKSFNVFEQHTTRIHACFGNWSFCEVHLFSMWLIIICRIITGNVNMQKIYLYYLKM